MATLKVPEEDCIQLLGEPFTEVHEWLDELLKYLGPSHRRFRHNLRGVEEVRKRWGDKAARAAEINIERDSSLSLERGRVGVRKSLLDHGE